ncbi:hypothetical protein Tel_11960 [Candidatus Tenderia electrophaga]|uniref:Chemotaxis protein n=1 Tax=Candidatus Tenderia electrophaga TaxID=1748243 RepID=A0A0S2TFD0_9GAMM|nr:hypothetical protein Tel_11960 [Candidatus Tenderia electrophaga]
MRINISTKIGGAVLGLGAMLLVSGGAGYFAASKLSDGLDYVTTVAWDAADGSMEGTIALQDQIIAINAFAQETDPGRMKQLKQRIEEGVVTEKEAISRMVETGLFDEKTLAEFTRVRKEFASSRNDLIEAVEEVRVVSNGDTIRAMYAAQQDLAQSVEVLLGSLAKMEALGDGKVENYHTELETVKTVSFSVLTTTVVVGVVLAILAFFMIVTTVIRPIKRIATSFIEIAEGEGDLTISLPEKGNDEITAVSRGFNLFVTKTRQTIQDVVAASTQINTSIQALSAINTQTNNALGRQQQETDQVATAMNEMVATVQEVARNVSDAAHAANQANEESNSGQETVNAAINKIERLANEVQQAAEVLHRVEEDSQKVGTVLDVIKDIAEQTNLLALNAAIEAARAGEQGRGFAVVADEVRTLAGRTQQSTEEIQKMIENLQSGTREAVDVMERGQRMTGETVDQANKAGEALQAIAAAVATITNMTTQVASAAEEQNAVAEEINSNIVNISNLANETTEGAQHSSSAADQMAQLADQLQQAVARFKI